MLQRLQRSRLLCRWPNQKKLEVKSKNMFVVAKKNLAVAKVIMKKAAQESNLAKIVDTNASHLTMDAVKMTNQAKGMMKEAKKDHIDSQQIKKTAEGEMAAVIKANSEIQEAEQSVQDARNIKLM